MKYVLDSSVAFKWVVPERDTPRAVQLRDEFRAGVHELIAPDVFPLELAHALTRAERQGRITGAVTRLIDVLASSPILIPSLRCSCALPTFLRRCAWGSTTASTSGLPSARDANRSPPIPGSWQTSVRPFLSSSMWQLCHDLCHLGWDFAKCRFSSNSDLKWAMRDSNPRHPACKAVWIPVSSLAATY